jgi:hypothetical protein
MPIVLKLSMAKVFCTCSRFGWWLMGVTGHVLSRDTILFGLLQVQYPAAVIALN